MIVNHIEIVTVATVLLFCTPALAVARKQELIKTFNFRTLLTTLNKSFPIQFVIGVVLGLSSLLMDQLVYKDNAGSVATDIIMGTAYTYVVLGIFFYVPVLVIINLFRFSIRVKARKV